MASVTSLDQDMRNLRLSRYTPQAAKEVRVWIEETLGEQLPPGDLLEALKDGVTLCKLVNLALPPPGVKFKKSAMPFIQMENISQFLKACEMPPLNMPAHDRFLTVDLYESKDPAQVLQCLGSFSRKAHAASPSRFRTTIGPKKAGGVVSPTNTGGGMSNGSAESWRQNSTYGRPSSPTKPSSAMPSARAMSPALTGGSTGSQKTDGGTRSPAGPVSSWSSRKDEGNTSPAWNIHQYGYMGGASQGNQGISFGARRQITSQAPTVPSGFAAEKERKRKEVEAENARLKQAAEEAEVKRRVEREAEEDRERVEEERRWEEETRRVREEERRRVEEQKRQWEAQERRWKEEEEARRKEEVEIQGLLMPKKGGAPERPRVSSSSILRGQSLAQYQKEQQALNRSTDGSEEEEDLTPEQARVRDLERQLEEARERERVYQAEREERFKQGSERGSRPGTASTTETARPQSEASWAPDEREVLRQQWQESSRGGTPAKVAAPVPAAVAAPAPISAPAPAMPGAQQQRASPFARQQWQPSQNGTTPPKPAPAGPTAQQRASPFERQQAPPPPLPAGPSLPSRRPLPQPTVEEAEPSSDEADEPAAALPSRPSQALQPSVSASSIPRLDPESAPTSSPLGSANRPLPTPDKEFEAYSPEQLKAFGGGAGAANNGNRTNAFLAAHAPPPEPRPRISSTQEAGHTSLEQQSDRDRRLASQASTRAGGWASKSLLEREMERERERQREWELEQQGVLKAATRDPKAGGGEGQGWDVNQYGYLGGDSQNRGSGPGSGVDFGGRRQILGPRAPPAGPGRMGTGKR